MSEQTFKQFLRASWKSYLFPVLAPIAVFIVSYFGTNIGWRVIPAALCVIIFMCGLTTLTLYNRWWIIEDILKSVRATGRTYKIPRE